MKLPSFFTRSKIIIIVAVVVIGIGSFLYFNRTKTPLYETITVSPGTLTQEVSVTGSVTPVKSAALAFEKGGKIKGIYVDVGQRVVAGQILAETDNAELRAGILDAEANLAAENAKLAEFKRGSRPEERRHRNSILSWRMISFVLISCKSDMPLNFYLLPGKKIFLFWRVCKTQNHRENLPRKTLQPSKGFLIK